MTRTLTAPPRLRHAALAALVAVTAAGCSSSTTEQTPTTTPTASSVAPLTGMQPGPTTTATACTGEQCSPDGAAVAGLNTLFTYRAADPDPAESAAARAGTLLADSYRAAVGDTWSLLAPYTGATWTRWRAENAVITAAARITSDEHPPDTTTRAYRVATITHTVTPTPEQVAPMTVYVVLANTPGQGWQIASITTT